MLATSAKSKEIEQGTTSSEQPALLTFRTSLIISTYNWPEALEACLSSIQKQTQLPDEIIISDDGSTHETQLIVETFQKIFSPIPLIHIWQPDQGFRKSHILNASIDAAQGDYLIFIDGDQVADRRFIQDHCQFAWPGTFAQGGRVSLSAEVSEWVALHRSAPSIGRFLRDPNTGMKIKGLRIPWLNKLNSLFKSRQSGKGIRGCNQAFWKQDLVNINGYDNRFTGWGYEDNDLAQRMINSGVMRRNNRFGAIVYHLFHQSSGMPTDQNHEFYLQSKNDRNFSVSLDGISEIIKEDILVTGQTTIENQKQFLLEEELAAPLSAYVINLESDTQRLEATRQQIQRLGLPMIRIDAIRGINLTDEEDEFDALAHRLKQGKRRSPSEIGCYQSHIKALNSFLASDNQYALICEDDISVFAHTRKVIDYAIGLRTSWDIIKLTGLHRGSHLILEPLFHNSSASISFTSMKGSGAYLVSRAGAKKLVEAAFPISLPYDHYLEQNWRYKGLLMTVTPLPMAQRAGGPSSTMNYALNLKLPFLVRVWTVGPYRLYTEIRRVLSRLSCYIKFKSRINKYRSLLRFQKIELKP